VYEAVKVKQRHAQMLAINLAEKLFGCCTRVAALNRSTQTSHKAFPNEKVCLSSDIKTNLIVDEKIKLKLKLLFSLTNANAFVIVFVTLTIEVFCFKLYYINSLIRLIQF
jgi:hypothetical protein